MKFGEDMLSPSHFVITSPSFVHRYSQHLGQLECLNWNSPLMIPLEQRQFSIGKNLMVCCLKKYIYLFANVVHSKRLVVNQELKQPRRRRQQKPHKFAYLTMKNSIFARFARAYFIF